MLWNDLVNFCNIWETIRTVIASLCHATSFAFGHFLDQFYANGTAGKYVCDDGFYQKDADPICVSGNWKGTPYCYR